jgi:hypothetical protein
MSTGTVTSLQYEDIDLRRSRIIDQIHELRDQRGLPPLLDAPQAPSPRSPWRPSSLPSAATAQHALPRPSYTEVVHTSLISSAQLAQPTTTVPSHQKDERSQNLSVPSYQQPIPMSFSTVALKQLSLGLSVLGLGLQVEIGGLRRILVVTDYCQL